MEKKYEPEYDAAAGKTGEARDKLLAACKAGLAYDACIAGRAARGEACLLESGGAVAEGEDLDALYMNWVTLTREAVALAERMA